MKIGSRLSKSLVSLVRDVLPLARDSHIAFLESLRSWFHRYLAAIYQDATHATGVELLLTTPPEELPVTDASIQMLERQLKRYQSGELRWTLDAIERIISETIVHRDWETCCDDDEYHIEYVVDMRTGQVVKVCQFCPRAFTLSGQPRPKPLELRPALKTDLIKAGVLSKAT